MKWFFGLTLVFLLGAALAMQVPRVALWTGFDARVLKFASLQGLTSASSTKLELGLTKNILSGVFETGFIAGRFDTVVLSWNAFTPTGTALQLEARARVGGTWSKFFRFGSWSTDLSILNKSVTGQADSFGDVDTDTLKLKSYADALQIRVRFSSKKVGISPTLFGLAAVMSDSSQHKKVVFTKSNQAVWGTDLLVPMRSQMIYPNGGNVWCSPTSTTMLLEYWSAKLGRNLADAVPLAAKTVWDTTYDGAGNWSFNMAYASSKGMKAYVHRLSSLTEAEKYIAKGIPLALSLAWKMGGLDGAAMPSSNGHLLVLRGFTKTGDAIVNDPAASTDATVRRVYNRIQLERAWIEASGGMVYILEAR
jgi:Peptidase_C39 like family